VRQLSFIDTANVLAHLEGLEGEEANFVLVGGQAVAVWAAKYASRVPALAAEAPYTSKDLDFCGGPKTVEAFARRLHGEAKLADPFDPTPNSGIVTFETEDGIKVEIDFLKSVAGVDTRELFKLRVAIDLPLDDGRTGTLFVMHPVLCLESRCHNTSALPGYDRPNAIKQLRAAVICAREFLRDVLDDGDTKAVLRLNERIFRFATRNLHAKAVLARHHIDPADAILVDDRLPEAFRGIRYPQMKAELARRNLPA
jgi:hypothetical protein